MNTKLAIDWNDEKSVRSAIREVLGCRGPDADLHRAVHAMYFDRDGDLIGKLLRLSLKTDIKKEEPELEEAEEIVSILETKDMDELRLKFPHLFTMLASTFEVLIDIDSSMGWQEKMKILSFLWRCGTAGIIEGFEGVQGRSPADIVASLGESAPTN